jgi:putative transposase
VIGADRSSVRYRSRRPEDGLLRLRLREIALRRRFGYHRLHILREGIAVNRKKLRRLYGHCAQPKARPPARCSIEPDDLK